MDFWGTRDTLFSETRDILGFPTVYMAIWLGLTGINMDTNGIIMVVNSG